MLRAARKAATVFVFVSFALGAHAAEVDPALVGKSFPEFALPSLQGGEVSLASLRGRNVIVIVPRVQYGEGKWCTICNYGYAELVALDDVEDFRKRTNTEVVFLVPFGREVASAWIEQTPEELAKIKGWKSPSEADKADENRMRFVENVRRMLPMDLSAEKGKVRKPFPILLDADRALASRLGVFASEWGGAKADQGIPATYVLDAEGVVRFKHVAQTSTWDRPETRTLLDFVAAMNEKASIPAATRDAIIATSLDYVEGWYQGDALRMRRALHPDLAKRNMSIGGDGQPVLRTATVESLTANPKARPLDPGQKIRVEILDVDRDLASVKIVSPLFFDYAHLVLWQGQWKVLNVAWR